VFVNETAALRRIRANYRRAGGPVLK